MKYIFLDETRSTNDYLHALIDEKTPDEATVVCADFQSSGRGQIGNSWESEYGKNLLCSILLCPETVGVHEQFYISQAISLALVDTLNELGVESQIKWPNDIYVGEKKIAGILIENILSGHQIQKSIVGIGLNLNQEQFFSSAPNPISVIQILNHEVDVKRVLNMLVRKLMMRYNSVLMGEKTKIATEYKAHLFRNKGFFPYRKFDGTLFSAQIENILPTGHLQLRTVDNQLLTFAFKEVEFVL